MEERYKLHLGDCLEVLKTLDDASVHCCVTSPPYFGLRDYGHEGQIGLEDSPDAFVAKLVEVFREVRRVLRDDGTLWLNLGDSYVGSANNGGVASKTMQGTQAATGKNLPTKGGEGLKPKDLIGIPWRVAFALQADGWYLRQDIIWHKPNPMPESVQDRCTKAHEYIFLLTKSARYHYDAEAVAEAAANREPGNKSHKHADAAALDASGRSRTKLGLGSVEASETRNKRSVWTVATHPYKEAHFATFPPALIRPCVLAGCPTGGVVLDPFNGAGTTGLVALSLGCKYVGIELNPEYLEMARRRIEREARQRTLDFGGA